MTPVEADIFIKELTDEQKEKVGQMIQSAMQSVNSFKNKHNEEPDWRRLATKLIVRYGVL